ncbi:ChbG/HpnK family deacetylase [Paenibacillus sp. FSL H8-0332]|uniref:ChbG/HpnK family deacetylase n=1 Tax=Paenibacillus sp. FSL H8-0332 TaxID=2954742 RepID=UPI0030D21D81
MISKLGFSSDDRLLIINADDFGITKGTNEAIVSLFEQQAITSTSIMFPCPAAREALELSNQKVLDNIGIHLTLTSDENHSYSPVFQERPLKSLINKDGNFHNDISYIEKNADDEVRIEIF